MQVRSSCYITTVHGVYWFIQNSQLSDTLCVLDERSIIAVWLCMVQKKRWILSIYSDGCASVSRISPNPLFRLERKEFPSNDWCCTIKMSRVIGLWERSYFSHTSVICETGKRNACLHYSEGSCGNPNYWSSFSDPNSTSSRGVLCILARSSQKCWYCETLWIPNFIVSDSGLQTTYKILLWYVSLFTHLTLENVSHIHCPSSGHVGDCQPCITNL